MYGYPPAAAAAPVAAASIPNPAGTFGAGLNAPPEHKIFVGGLAQTSTAASLGAYFAQYGPVLEARLVTDRMTGRSKGYAFITFSDAESAARAAAPGAHMIDGRSCNANVTTQREQAIASFREQSGQKRAQEPDAADGPDAKRRRTEYTPAPAPAALPYAPAPYGAPAPYTAAPYAAPAMPYVAPGYGSPVMPALIPGRPGDPKIFVAGLLSTTTEASLSQALSIFGEVVEVRIIADKETGESKGYAFATFADPAAAARAAQCTVLFIEGRRCTTNLASAKPPKKQ